MKLRLLQIVIDTDRREALAEVLDAHPTFGRWDEALAESRVQANVLTEAKNTEALMDELTDRLGHDDTFRVVLLEVEATLPRPADDDVDEPPSENKPKNNDRISREEMHGEVSDAVKITPVWLAMVALSAMVAAVGLMRDSVAVIIGAMVIAPLLGPNVAMALATTLGDLKLGRRALIANIVGMTFALSMSVVAGALIPFDPDVPAIAERATVSITDIVVGLAAGAAGTLAFTTGVSATMVGVMVAVALLPPTVVCGMMLGVGHWDAAAAAAMLVAVNVVCINLAGVTTFLLQGVRPRTWYEADAAKKASRTAMVLWVGIPLVFSAVILVVYDLHLW